MRATHLKNAWASCLAAIVERSRVADCSTGGRSSTPPSDSSRGVSPAGITCISTVAVTSTAPAAARICATLGASTLSTTLPGLSGPAGFSSRGWESSEWLSWSVSASVSVSVAEEEHRASM